MVERIFIHIKHNLKFIWRLIEWINGWLFYILFRKRFIKVTEKVISKYGFEDLEFRVLYSEDLVKLQSLAAKQPVEDMHFFKPHEFDQISLIKMYKNHAFLMMGVFDGSLMVGYFFLRCFCNKNCFVGRLVDSNYHGKGIGKVMNEIMYNIAWGNGFRCLSTISKNNKAVIAAHAKNKTMVILKELDNDYMMVEFVQNSKVEETGSK